MDKEKKNGRYHRVFKQLEELLGKCSNTNSRLSTVSAVLHHKMDNFFWTGFYLLDDGKLFVGPYQGPLACMELQKNMGICWAGINKKETICVPDVNKFPGHIACDSRSKSEIVVPLIDNNEKLVGVLDVDSNKLNTFDNTDTLWLKRIVDLVYKVD